MYSCFNLSTHNQFEIYQDIGDTVFNNNKKEFIEGLGSHIDLEGNINGTSLQSTWFPQLKSDIFISHSHKDENQAKGLAGWLYKEFGLNTFIDSCVWGYSIDLLKQIDEKYCLSEDKKMYSYEKRNYSTSHVHMMLSTALTMMIDKTESLIFLNTPNSLCTTDIVNKTESPWIYYEIAMTNLVRNKKLSEYRQGIIQKALFSEQASLNIKYDVNLNHLYELTQTDLNVWSSNFSKMKNEHPLDTLYRNKQLIK
ncbi:toll/interleukin-1 receptor domain-containing protein [Bacillus cereus]|nr:toll/interleukin-1 receptor domain-containing protein [Bacillus cereus]